MDLITVQMVPMKMAQWAHAFIPVSVKKLKFYFISITFCIFLTAKAPFQKVETTNSTYHCCSVIRISHRKRQTIAYFHYFFFSFEKYESNNVPL